MGVMAPAIRPAPWWLTWFVAGGLAVLFVGERLVGGPGLARVAVSGLGAVVVLGGVVWRFLSWRTATGEGKRVEGMLFACYVGCVLAVVGFVVSSSDGMRWLGIVFDERAAERRYESALQVLSSILLAASLLPALGAQWALSAHRHAGKTAMQVESQRVHETAGAALTIALAGAALMLAGYIASEWDKTVDVSYFKTSSPGTGAQEMARNISEPLQIFLFFPAVNAVKDEVTEYFRALADATGNVVLEEHDRMVSSALAREHSVTADGTIVLVRGERSERLTLPTQIGTARARLRTLDRDVQERLWRLARDPRTAYLTVGHGEFNGPAGDEADPLQKVDLLKDGLRVFNYRVEDLGLRQGLGRAIPDNAAMVLVLGPRSPFLEEELEALDRYLAAGGAVLLALDPDSDFRLGLLEERLGVRYQRVPLANDERHLRRRGNVSDRQLIVTDRFTAHEAVTTLGRTRVGSGILLLGSGYLETADSGGPRPRFVVRALPTTYADLNENYEFDSATEVRMSYNLVAAIEGRESSAGMRALVYADAGMFTDGVISSIALNAALFSDGVRWLGGDEAFGGEITSEEDIPIVHTRAQDVALFYLTILGAPLLILAAGTVTVVRRRSGRTAP
ncbi:MAG: Gldg family protein [Gemmatimonadetes bacterium]|nr:Gldg family protein [Gemmatimonadota bacterium]